MTTNHSPPWGAVRYIVPGQTRYNVPGQTRYNAGAARFVCPDCTSTSNSMNAQKSEQTKMCHLMCFCVPKGTCVACDFLRLSGTGKEWPFSRPNHQ